MWRGRGGGGGYGGSSSRGGSSRSNGASSSSKQSNKPCPNPIFESWLQEWREDAVEKNSKMQFVFSKALNSLRKYPLSLSSGRECMVLEFFGQGLCKMIDSRISAEGLNFRNGNSSSNLADIIQLDSPPRPPPAKTKGGKRKKASQAVVTGDGSDSDDEDQDNHSGKSPPKKGKKKAGTESMRVRYIPAFRSGGYALLVTLFKKEDMPGYRGYMLKSELQREAQDHCEASFTRPDNPGSNYTAWNSMATLTKKGLVLKEGNPVKFLLTIEGRMLAAKLLGADAGAGPSSASLPPPPSSTDGVDGEDSDSTVDTMPATSMMRTVLEPGKFEILLCVDTSETNAKCKQDEVINELRKNGISLEVTRLNVGDFVWICRKSEDNIGNRHRLTISRTHDLVLPYVVERKRADDLAHSIKDGRFHEQKHRLEGTGLKSIYLMESHGTGDWGLADGALTQAMANTQIINNFLIQETSSIKDTCAYLTHMTRSLSKLFQSKRISSCMKEEWPTLKDSTSATYLMTFNDFNEFATKTKNWTVREMFAKHLMKLRGLSVEKAHTIIQRFPTPHSLLHAFKECESDKEREALLSTLHFGTGGRTIGPAVAKSVLRLYSSTILT